MAHIRGATAILVAILVLNYVAAIPNKAPRTRHEEDHHSHQEQIPEGSQQAKVHQDDELSEKENMVNLTNGDVEGRNFLSTASCSSCDFSMLGGTYCCKTPANPLFNNTMLMCCNQLKSDPTLFQQITTYTFNKYMVKEKNESIYVEDSKHRRTIAQAACLAQCLMVNADVATRNPFHMGSYEDLGEHLFNELPPEWQARGDVWDDIVHDCIHFLDNVPQPEISNFYGTEVMNCSLEPLIFIQCLNAAILASCPPLHFNYNYAICEQKLSDLRFCGMRFYDPFSPTTHRPSHEDSHSDSDEDDDHWLSGSSYSESDEIDHW